MVFCFKTDLSGDNDPFDAIDISNIPVEVGTVNNVEILGAIPIFDSGEMDWKVFKIFLTTILLLLLLSFNNNNFRLL